MKAVFLLSFVFFSLTVYSTDSIPSRKIALKTLLVSMDGKKHKGYLSHLNDSSVYISDVQIIYGNPDTRAQKKFVYSDISQISLRRKGSIARGYLFGTLGGAVIGAIIGLATYQKPNCDPNAWFCFDFGPGVDALGGGLIGALGGGLAGGIIGAAGKKAFKIGGKKENIDAFKMSVLQRAYNKK